MIESLVVQITTKCPYHCAQCYMEKGNETIPLEVVKEAIDSQMFGEIQVLQITGGEPTVCPDLPEIVEHAHQEGLYCVIATSGYRHSLEFYDVLKQKGVTLLCVSINDVDESINRLSRDTYVESILAIKDAIEVGLVCCANVVVSDQNIQNFRLLASYLKRLGVEGIEVLRPVESFDGQYVPSVSPRTIQQLDDIVREDPNFFRVENCFKEYWEYTTRETFVCRDAGNRAIFMNVDGTVSPCSKLQRFRYNSIDEMMKDKLLWKGGCCR